MEALAEVIAAAGLDHPDELRPWHIYLRTKRTEVLSYHEAFDFLQPGELLNDCPYPVYKKVWDLASADTFETHHG